MTDRIIAKRYAEGFLAFARKTIDFGRAVKELEKVKIVLSSNPELEDFLENLEMTFTEKCAVIDKVFGDLSEETRQFLKLLLEKGRMDKITFIADYIRTTYGHGEKVDAVLKSAFPLDLELLEEIKKKMESKFKKKLNLYLNLDPDLIGGVQVSVGNEVVDGSVRKRIEELKDKLMAVKV